ncbi:MAG: sulfatase family protein [Phocaeicola sp.]
MKTSYLKMLPVCATTLALTSYAHTLQAQSNEEKRPNILYIMSDDHSYQTIGAYGYGLNETPNIDRLSTEGMRFDRCFVTNSISGPSRACMITGKFSHKNGFYDNAHSTVFDGSQQTLPKLLKAAGYQTAVIGKWHLKSEPTGFDYYSVHYDQGEYYNPHFMENGQKRVPYQGYATDLTTDNTIRYLEGADKTKPFFVMMQFKAPHRNWMSAPEKLSMYEEVIFPEPSNLFDTYEGRAAAAAQEMTIDKHMTLAYDLKLEGMDKSGGVGERKRMTPEQLKQWDDHYMPIAEELKQKGLDGKALVSWKYQRYMRDYLKCISSVDDNVGRMLDYLEKTGEIDNTVIIYTSDQGFYMGEHGWYDKRFMYEESLRTPFLIRAPKGLKGQSTKAMIQNIDFAPTILDMAGLAIPEDIQGESFRQVVTGEKEKAKEAVYYHYYEFPDPHAVKKHYGIRTERYKLIHFYDDIDTWELYDLQTDPQEMKNLINEPSQQERIGELKDQLQGLLVKYDDVY